MSEWKDVRENYRSWKRDYDDGTEAVILEEGEQRYRLTIAKRIYRYVDNATAFITKNTESHTADRVDLVVFFPEVDEEFDSLEEAVKAANLQAAILASVE